MVPRFLGLAQFERNCKMPDPQKVSILVHLSRGLLVKTLTSLLKNPDFGSYIINENCDQSPVGEYRCFKEGLAFKNVIGTINPLRGNSENHSTALFYFSIDNLPSHLQTYSLNIFLFSLCYSADVKK